MAERVITIEIGTKITKVCETDYKGSPAVYNYFCFETPEGMVENQIIQENETFRTTLEEMLRRHNIRTRKTVFVISTIGIGTKEEVIPNMKETRIQEFLKTNLSNFFPVDSKECHVAYRINGVTPDGRSRVQLYAINSNIIFAYQALAQFCGLNLLDMEFSENGVAQSLQKNHPQGNLVNVNVEDDHTAITIVRDGEVALQRSIAYGLDDSVRAIQEGTASGVGLTYLEALGSMGQVDRIYHSYQEAMDDPKHNDIMVEATEGLRYMVSNVTRILEYYQSQNQGISFDRMILSGLGSGCKGLPELLHAETGYEFLLVDDALVGKTAKNLDENIKSIAFTAIVSASTQKGLLPKAKKLDLEKMFKEPDDNSTARKLFAVCVLISVVLIAVPVVRRVILNGQKVSLEAAIASMQDARQANDEYQKTKTEYEELQQMCDLEKTPNDAFLSLLSEMEHGIPAEAAIMEMSASQANVVIYFNVPSKEVAARTVQAFREFSSVDHISVDALELEESAEEGGGASYNFTLTCYYPGSWITEEEEGATDGSGTQSTENATKEDAQ